MSAINLQVEMQMDVTIRAVDADKNVVPAEFDRKPKWSSSRPFSKHDQSAPKAEFMDGRCQMAKRFSRRAEL